MFSWETNISGAADAFSLGYYLVPDDSGTTSGCCRNNRYARYGSSTSTSFTYVQRWTVGGTYSEASCKSSCDGEA